MSNSEDSLESGLGFSWPYEFNPYQLDMGTISHSPCPYPYYTQGGQPFVYFAQVNQPYSGPKSHEKRSTVQEPPMCTFKKAYEWYNKEHVQAVSQSDKPDASSFAQWLDSKYQEFLTTGNKTTGGCAGAGGTTEKGKCMGVVRVARSTTKVTEVVTPRPKKFFRLRSPWRSRQKEQVSAKNIEDKKRSTSQSCEFILQPQSLSKPTSRCCNQMCNSGQSINVLREWKTTMSFSVPNSKTTFDFPAETKHTPPSKTKSDVKNQHSQNTQAKEKVTAKNNQKTQRKETVQMPVKKCCPCAEKIIAIANNANRPEKHLENKAKIPAETKDAPCCTHKKCPRNLEKAAAKKKKELEAKMIEVDNCECHPKSKQDKKKSKKKPCTCAVVPPPLPPCEKPQVHDEAANNRLIQELQQIKCTCPCYERVKMYVNTVEISQKPQSLQVPQVDQKPKYSQVPNVNQEADLSQLELPAVHTCIGSKCSICKKKIAMKLNEMKECITQTPVRKERSEGNAQTSDFNIVLDQTMVYLNQIHLMKVLSDAPEPARRN